MKHLVLLMSLLVPLSSIAAEKLPIGYVDLHRVLLESKVGKKNKAELDKLIKDRKTAISREESKLQAMQQAYQKDQLLMTQDQKDAKQKEFQTRVEAYQNMVKAAEQEVNSKDNEYTTGSLADIKTIIAEIAKERKLTMIFGTSEAGLLYADPELDLTQLVIERYDAKAK
jgi:outer membrane protein